MRFLRKYDDLIIIAIGVVLINLSFHENVFHTVVSSGLYIIAILLTSLIDEIKKLVRMKGLEFQLSKERE